MSVRASSWAWEQRTANSGTKLVLLALADHAGEDFTCFPSSGRIAAKTGLSERTVREYLEDLAEAGVISKMRRQRRQNGTLGTWLYRLNEHQSDPSTSGDGSPVATGRQRRQVRSTSDDGSAQPVTTGLRAEPSCEPSFASHVEIDVRDDDPHGVARLTKATDVEIVDPADHDVERLCELLADSIAACGSKRPSVTVAWRTDMGRIIRLDERSPDDIARVIRWLSAARDDTRPVLGSEHPLAAQAAQPVGPDVRAAPTRPATTSHLPIRRPVGVRRATRTRTRCRARRPERPGIMSVDFGLDLDGLTLHSHDPADIVAASVAGTELLAKVIARWREPWMRDAACAGTDVSVFFPGTGERNTAAMQLCGRCPVP